MSGPDAAETPLKVVVSGASGLIGSALVPLLRSRGHEVVTLVRRAPKNPSEIPWDPASGSLDPKLLTGVTAAVNLSGAGVSDRRWTPSYRKLILDSRVSCTNVLASGLAELGGVQSLVSASGIDYYQASDQPTLEDSAAGQGFLADVCRQWEAAADPARAAGVSVSHLRTGLVLARKGGVLSRLGPLISAGLGGPLGGGHQWWSWITLPDQVAAIALLLEKSVSGPVNLVSPNPIRQAEFIRVLAQAARRPAFIPAPGFALRLALGEFAESILASRRIIPGALTELGFEYQHPQLAQAAAWLHEH